MTFIPLEFNALEMERDSVVAGTLLSELNVGCIITLGGDGTNRAVSMGCGNTPIVPVSTGTNNVFPRMIEGTIAGLAAGVVAMGAASGKDVMKQRKRLELYLDGQLADIALIDLAILQGMHVAARAMWTVDNIRQVFVTQCAPYSIGISAIAGQFMTIKVDEPEGMMLALGEGSYDLRAAIAPGIISMVDVSETRVLSIGDEIHIGDLPCMVAADGERNLMIPEGKKATVKLTWNGPVVVDIEAALEMASASGFFFERKHLEA